MLDAPLPSLADRRKARRSEARNARAIAHRIEVFGRCAAVAFDIGSAYEPLLTTWIEAYRRNVARLRER